MELKEDSIATVEMIVQRKRISKSERPCFGQFDASDVSEIPTFDCAWPEVSSTHVFRTGSSEAMNEPISSRV